VRIQREKDFLSDTAAHETTIWKRKVCPECGQQTVAQLLMGMPADDPDLWDEIERGDLVLGGCVIPTALACDMPSLICTSCDWTGFELRQRLFEANDLLGVMNAHAQHGAELFLQGAGLGFFVNDTHGLSQGSELTPGWTEMLATLKDAYGKLVEHAATVSEASPADHERTDWFDDEPLVGHANLRHEAEESLRVMREQLVGLALVVIGMNATSNDNAGVEMADRAASEVLRHHLDDAGPAIETTHAASLDGLRVELAGKVCVLVMMHGFAMTLTDHTGKAVHFGWRCNPLGEWQLALWQDGCEPSQTWSDPLTAVEVVDAITSHVNLGTKAPTLDVSVRPLSALSTSRFC
jgi:hypothetical protein